MSHHSLRQETLLAQATALLCAVTSVVLFQSSRPLSATAIECESEEECCQQCYSSSSEYSSESSSSSVIPETPPETPSTPQSSGGDPQGEPGNGSHRGHDTNRLFTAMQVSAALYGFNPGMPPPAYGGSDVPFTKNELALLCSVQRNAMPENDPALYAALAGQLALITGRDEAYLESALQNTALCEDIMALLRPRYVERNIEPRPVVLAEDGYPYSPSNDTWNKCVRGTATLEDIKNNPDYIRTRSGVVIPKDCGWYRYTATHLWKYPDDPMLTLLIVPSVPTTLAPYVAAPSGYAVIAPETTVVSQ